MNTPNSTTNIPKPPTGKGFISHLCYWLAVGLGSGLAKKAPGTFGTLASLVFFPLFFYIPLIFVFGIIAISAIFGVFICGKASTDMGVHDSGHIVWDEWVGQWIAFAPLIYMGNSSLLFLALSFVLFRFFDILKPFPINWLDKKLEGGLGIMLDDVLAGVFSALGLIAVIYFLWH